MADNRNVKQDLVNRDIKLRQVIIIGDDGQREGPMNKFDALKIAEEQGMDLLQVGVQNNVAIAKILDYGKFKYEQKKKQQELKKNQSKVENKEIRLTVNIGDHDLDTKAKKAREFLEAGDRVKISLKFKGREIAFQEFGLNTIKKFYSKIEDVAKIEKDAQLNVRYLDMYVVPKK